MKKTFLVYMTLAVALVVLAPSAKADLLTPGQTANNPGDVNPNNPNTTLTLIASTGVQNYTSVLGPTDFTGQYIVGAYYDSANTLCGVAGQCVDIVAQVYESAASVNDIEEITLSSFSGFQTDISYYPGWFYNLAPFNASTEVLAASVSRVTNSTVSYFFDAPITPGTESELIDVMTNGTTYVPGHLSVQNDGTTTVLGYGPSVPEPATLSLLGIGLLGLFGLRKKENA